MQQIIINNFIMEIYRRLQILELIRVLRVVDQFQEKAEITPELKRKELLIIQFLNILREGKKLIQMLIVKEVILRQRRKEEGV